MNYEKLTVDRFALNLKEGKYSSVTGARRAIGKTGSWSAKEKEAAQSLANKHFKVTDAPVKPASKPAAVAAAPKPVPKPAVKVAKKAAKKASVKAVSSLKPDVDVVSDAKEEYKAPPARTPVTSFRATGSNVSPIEAIQMGEQVLTFLGQAREQINFQKTLNPSGDFSKAISVMDDAFTRAITLVATSIPSTATSVEESLPPPRVSLPKSEPTPPPKPVVKAPFNVVPMQAVVSSHADVATPVSEPETLTLTPAEQEQAAALRNATPVSSFASLPRPAVVQE